MISLMVEWDDELEKNIRKMIYPPKLVWQVPYYIAEAQFKPRKPEMKINISEQIDRSLSWNQNMHHIQSVLSSTRKPNKIKKSPHYRKHTPEAPLIDYSPPTSAIEFPDVSLDPASRTLKSITTTSKLIRLNLNKITLEDSLILK